MPEMVATLWGIRGGRTGDADGIFLWLQDLTKEQVALPPNKKMYLTFIPLRSIKAGDFGVRQERSIG